MLVDAQWRDVIGKNSHSITQPNSWSKIWKLMVPSKLKNFIADAMIYGCRQGQLQSMDPSLSCVGGGRLEKLSVQLNGHLSVPKELCSFVSFRGKQMPHW